MKVIQFMEKCEIVTGNTIVNTFEKNEFYIMSDDLLQKVRLLVGDYIGLEIPFNEVYNQYKNQDLTNKKLLCLRHGGGGDILFMATGIAELKRKFPSVKVGAAISEMYNGILKGNPNFHEILHIPISLKEWNEYHYHLIFENLIENNRLATQYNAYDLFLAKMGFNPKDVPPENKLPEISILEEEKDKVKKLLPNLQSPRKKVGIQVEASSPIRKYPPFKLVDVCKELFSRGYQVYLFGSSAQRNTIESLAKMTKTIKVIYPLREAITIASFMDFFIAPDSLFVHVAGAFRIPLIGLYGPFHSNLRMKYFINSIGINSKVPCSPCFKHGFHPCEKGNPSPCFSLITPEVIIKAFDKLEESSKK